MPQGVTKREEKDVCEPKLSETWLLCWGEVMKTTVKSQTLKCAGVFTGPPALPRASAPLSQAGNGPSSEGSPHQCAQCCATLGSYSMGHSQSKAQHETHNRAN